MKPSDIRLVLHHLLCVDMTLFLGGRMSNVPNRGFVAMSFLHSSLG